MQNELILNRLGQLIELGEIDNTGIVQIIELCGGYLNLKTIPDYARENNLSYNGVKNFRNTIKLFEVKFVIENL